MFVAGFDPGGRGNFGWAVLEFDEAGAAGILASGITDGAMAAVCAVKQSIWHAPVAIGIDAPLFWSMCGDRKADKQVRKQVKNQGGKTSSVSAVNSLQGACLAQGILTAALCRKLWISTLITESHPKALLAVLPDAGQFVKSLNSEPATEHERDALVAGYSAFCAYQETMGWSDLLLTENEPFFPGGTQVSYWFPAESTV